MDIYRLIHIIIRNLKYIAVVPFVTGALMFVLTIDQPQSYTSKASIFTAITSNSSLEDLGESRVDYFATKTAYNNLLSIINSRNVIEETSLRLLTQHLMLDKSNPSIISEESFEELQKKIPGEIRELVNKNNAEETYQNLAAYMQENRQNFIYGLLNLDHPHYSHKAISKIQAVQVGGSDIIELSYESNDPGITYQTLNVLIDVFLNRYKHLKNNQTNAAVEYFEKQLQKSSVLLNDAEDRLLNFNRSNNIINYYEQTKHISSQQEKIEVKLQEILMEYKAAGAVLDKLEVETKTRFNINLKNKEIMDIRKSLINVNQKLAELEIDEEDTLMLVSPFHTELDGIRDKLELGLQGKLDSLYVFEYNSEGIAIETLLNDWLKTVIEYESAKARLLAMQAKSEEFKKLYSQFAPLGAILKRIEREINVREKEYLEILHHLGLAKLKQQNEEMMANMKVLDKPQLPIDPKPTKRKLYIIIVGLFSAILSVFGIVVFELLDKRIKTVSRFNELTDLKNMGAGVLDEKVQGINIEGLKRKGFKQTIEHIIENINTRSSDSPIIIQFFSNWDNEGKSQTINTINKLLTEIGYKSEIIQFGNNGNENHVTIPLKEVFTKTSYQKLISKHISKNTEVVFLEIPVLSDNLFNPHLYKSADISFFIADANRTWSNADGNYLNKLKEQTENSLYNILNNVHPENMEEIAGEIPKKRSRFRRFIKQRIFKRLIS